MAAFSSCYNCNAVQTTVSPERSHCTSKPELAWELFLNDNEDDGFASVPSYLHDFYYDPISFLCSNISPNLLPPTFPCEPNMSLPQETFPLDETYEPLPKRQKCFHNQQSIPEFEPTVLLDGFLPQLQLPAMPLEFTCNSDANYCDENIVTDGYNKVEEKGVSAQSVAARERRRKISDKTQELGKLVPGRNKMNTAGMLQAASNYVKYLQAQVGVLQVMDNLKECDQGSSPMEDMQILLASCSVQGKLSSKEKCLVPKGFVAMLSNHPDVQSRPSIHDNLIKLIDV